MEIFDNLILISITGMIFLIIGYGLAFLMFASSDNDYDIILAQNRIDGLIDRIHELENKLKTSQRIKEIIEDKLLRQNELLKREVGFKKLFYYLLERRITKHERATEHIKFITGLRRLDDSTLDIAMQKVYDLYQELEESNKRLEKFREVI